MPNWENVFTLFWKKSFRKRHTCSGKSVHKVTVFDYLESLEDKFDMFWKITGFREACFGTFNEIVNRLLELFEKWRP